MGLIDDRMPILSFFTGGGFMDMGFINSGFNVVWTNEVDVTFSELYKSGITSWKNHNKISGDFEITNKNSIKDISTETIIKEAFDANLPSHFGVIGGPPCQDFSINGNMDGFKGDRGSLTDAFLYKIIELQPSFFVMENVTGLLKSKKTATHFKELLGLMESDYLIDFEVLNSLNYGVPQSRERVFVIGIKKSLVRNKKIKIDSKGKWFPFPKGNKECLSLLSWPKLNDFGDTPVLPKNIPINLCVFPCLVPVGDEKKVANGNEYFNLFIDANRLNVIKEGETNRPSFKRLHRFRYSPTTCYGNNEVHLHPFLNRRLSVREALRIQGVQDSYELPVKLPLSKKFKMIGNGVPVPLAASVAKSLSDFIEDLLSSKK